MSKLVIELNADHLLGEGCTKYCYQHPLNSNQVVKIIKSGASKSQSRRYLVRMKREINALKQAVKINQLQSYFPAYHGSISTNLGRGFVFDKVDSHQDIFKSHGMMTVTAYRQIKQVIRDLISHDIAFCPDLIRNLFINQRTQQLYFLDGLGCKYFIPATLSPFPKVIRRCLMKRMIKKHILRDLKILYRQSVRDRH